MNDVAEKLSTLRRGPAATVRRRSRVLWIVIAVVVLAVAAFLARGAFGQRAAAVETVQPTVISAMQAAAGPPLFSASGYVVARREAVVSSKIQGRLVELRVEEGDDVREGETIARLEDADFTAQVARADASIARAEAAIVRARADLAEFRRQLALQEKLIAEEVVSVDSRDAAVSRVTIAEAALAQTERELDLARAEREVASASLQNTVIRAPFSGTVVKKMAEVGESVAPIPPGVNISTASGAIVALADLATLEVEVDVAESSVARLAVEQPAWVVVEAFPDQRYRGSLRQIIPTADRTKATVMVKVTILDKDAKLKPEMSAQVDFLERMPDVDALRDAPPVVAVPPAAIATRDGRDVVFVVDGGVTRMRPVETGDTVQGAVVVKSGLAGDETVVVRPDDRLRDGAAVAAR